MRCTGPLAMSTVVCPSRLTAFDVGALRHEIQDHLVVAARGGVVQRRVAVVIARVDVGVQFLDEVFHRRQHAARRVAVRVAGEAFAVARHPMPRAAASCRDRRPGPAAAPETSCDVVAQRRRRREPARHARWWGCSDRRRTPPAASSRRRRPRTRRARRRSRRLRRSPRIGVVPRVPNLRASAARSDRRLCRAAPSSARDRRCAAARARAAADRAPSAPTGS